MNNDDPFERVRIDLDAALRELTQSTSAMLDGIRVAPVPRVDAVKAMQSPAAHRPRVSESPELVPEVLPDHARTPSTPRKEGTGSPGPATSGEPDSAEPRNPSAVSVPSSADQARAASPEPATELLGATSRRRPSVRAVVLLALAAGVLALAVGVLALAGAGRWWVDEESSAPAGTPTAKPGGGRPGQTVRLLPMQDGSVQVVHKVRYGSPVRAVEINAPASSRDTRRVSTSVSVRGSGRQTLRIAGSDASQTVSWDSPIDRLEIRYTVMAGVDLSGPDGRRGLIDVPVLGVDSPGQGADRLVLSVVGAKLRGVACGRTLRTVTPCGEKTASGWLLPSSEGRSTSILATADMPRG